MSADRRFRLEMALDLWALPCVGCCWRPVVEDGEECYLALPFVGCWLTAEDGAAAAVVCSAGFVVEKRAAVGQGG